MTFWEILIDLRAHNKHRQRIGSITEMWFFCSCFSVPTSTPHPLGWTVVLTVCSRLSIAQASWRTQRAEGGRERYQASQTCVFFAVVWVVAVSTVEALCQVGTPQGSSSMLFSPGVFRSLSTLTSPVPFTLSTSL